MEAEEYAEILDALRRACREIIPRHGGTIVQLLGDGVLAIFGFPAAQEGDGRRATQAALELHHAIRALPARHLAGGSSLTLHTGIHSGMVLVDQGDSQLGVLQLFGNVPNIASRLASAARADEILVSREALAVRAHHRICRNASAGQEAGQRRLHLSRRATRNAAFQARSDTRCRVSGRGFA
jgi:class 3 adenylate cyclase